MPITKDQSTKKIRLDFSNLKTKKAKQDAARAAGEVYIDAIQEHLDRGESPVEGGSYESFMADGSLSQLFESGSMRSALKSKPLYQGSDIVGVEVGIFPEAKKLDRLKASGHNRGDSANRTKRQFIPFPNRKFKDSINSEAQSAVNNFASSEDEEVINSLQDAALDAFILKVLSDEISD